MVSPLNSVKTLNEVFSSLSTRRRYEVWFLRLGLADGNGAWWFRYLLMNPGRGGCLAEPRGMPLQVWATWFPRDGKPQSYIQGFPITGLRISSRGQSPFYLRIGNNWIEENSCGGTLEVEGHSIAWNLRYGSTFRTTLSSRGWIGFSRTPHSDALFSGGITLDGRSFEGEPLGFGVQGHNCGYRHRGFWTWAHVYFPQPDRPPSTLEALVYDMPFGLLFRKAVLWHEGKQHVFRNLRERASPRGAGALGRIPSRNNFRWNFCCSSNDGLGLQAEFDGMGESIHCLPYMKTDCSCSFEVTNNSLARALVCLQRSGAAVQHLETSLGAVLEMAGRGE